MEKANKILIALSSEFEYTVYEFENVEERNEEAEEEEVNEGIWVECP
jgi:hypothetical protein